MWYWKSSWFPGSDKVFLTARGILVIQSHYLIKYLDSPAMDLHKFNSKRYRSDDGNSETDTSDSDSVWVWRRTRRHRRPKGLILSLKMKMKSTKWSDTGMIVLVLMSYERTPTTQALLALHCTGRRTPLLKFIGLWTFPGIPTPTYVRRYMIFTPCCHLWKKKKNGYFLTISSVRWTKLVYSAVWGH